MKCLRLAADQRKIILGHAKERGRFTAGRLLAVKAVTHSDEDRIGIELKFDCAARALCGVLLCHGISFLFHKVLGAVFGSNFWGAGMAGK